MTPALALMSLLICYSGGAGSPEQAQSSADEFLRHLENVAGWQKNSLSGRYEVNADQCAEYLRKTKPPLGIFSLPDLLRLGREWKLTPVAHVGIPAPKRYSILVRQSSVAAVRDLSGKHVLIPAGMDEKFLTKIVLQGSKDVPTFKITSYARPLQGVRAVSREQADAAVVDESVIEHLAELNLPALKILYTSPALPNLTLSIVGKHVPNMKKLTQDLKNAIPKLCTDEGENVCELFQITSFNAVEPEQFTALFRAYR